MKKCTPGTHLMTFSQISYVYCEFLGFQDLPENVNKCAKHVKCFNHKMANF